MSSKLDICNAALQNLGANKITSIDENSKGAIECKLRFNSARRTLLQMGVWNFAIKRASLNRDVTAPAFNYAYSYTLPADFLYMVMTQLEETYQGTSAKVYSNLYVHDLPGITNIDKYRIEADKLVTNDGECGIIYVADIEDTQKFSATFTELLTRYLTAMIAYRMTGSKSERDTQYQIFQQELDTALSIDSQQGVFDRLEVSEFLSSRL
jgi:hypothetical protein